MVENPPAVQGTWVRSLVGEDSTRVVCVGGGGLHNSACVPQLLSPRAATPEARALQQESNPHSPHLEKVHAQPKMNKINQLKNNDTETTGVNGRSPPLGE